MTNIGTELWRQEGRHRRRGSGKRESGRRGGKNRRGFEGENDGGRRKQHSKGKRGKRESHEERASLEVEREKFSVQTIGKVPPVVPPFMDVYGSEIEYPNVAVKNIDGGVRKTVGNVKKNDGNVQKNNNGSAKKSNQSTGNGYGGDGGLKKSVKNLGKTNKGSNNPWYENSIGSTEDFYTNTDKASTYNNNFAIKGNSGNIRRNIKSNSRGQNTNFNKGTSTKNAKSFTELYIEGMPSVYLLLHRVVSNAFIQLDSAKNYVNFSKEM